MILAFAFDMVSDHGAFGAEGMFVRQSTRLQAEDGRIEIGKIFPGTLVQVLAKHDSLAKIQVDGWSVKGAPRTVFAAMGQRILVARLSAAGQSFRKVMNQVDDTYRTTWERVSITGEVNRSDLVADVASVWASANKIFSERCSACHSLHRPKEFTANQWPSMLGMMTYRAALTDDQAELVTRYLQAHAKDSDSPR